MAVIITFLAFFQSCVQGNIHPDFMITHGQMKEKIRDLPEDIRSSILSKPRYFCDLLGGILDTPRELLLLVDKTHPLPDTYEPDDLVLIGNHPLHITHPKLEVRKIMIDDLLAMAKASEREGISLTIASAYRSYEYQKKVHEHWIKVSGEEAADKESARAGYSQHQLGTTIDFYPINDSFAETPASGWLSEHAHFFGFSLSYPAGYDELTGYTYEPWHYRYIGKKACQMTHEFFSGIQQYFLRFYHDHASYFSEKRKK
jgi:D-alanyl-D-alanine carboxypeptidase